MRLLWVALLAAGCNAGMLGAPGGEDPAADAAPATGSSDAAAGRPDARPAPDAPPAPAPADAAPPPAVVAVTLEIHAMDIWAQYLPAGATVQVTLGGSALAGDGAFPVRRVV